MNRTTEEWQALNRIWKRLTEEQKELCREDFRIVATSKRFKDDEVTERQGYSFGYNATGLCVKEGCTVRLLDINNNQLATYKIVAQTRKTHYKESSFYRGNYYYKQDQILEAGGDGTSTISLESTIGKAIKGKHVGDIVNYRNNIGEYERFEIKAIYD